MISDFHVHTCFSTDSQANIDEIINNAINNRMSHLCTTDHNDFDWPINKKDFILDTDSYFSTMSQYREKYNKNLDICIGIECGLQPQTVERNEALIASKPFDFVIGSIHIVNNYDPYYPEYFNLKTDIQGFTEYFEAMLNNIKLTDCFDVLGHMDYIVRYAPTKADNYSYEFFSEIIDEIIKIIIDKGKGIEVNTGGLAAGLAFPNPCADIVRRYRQLGGEIITIGSDAHTPDAVGRYFDLIPEYLKSCGFDYYTIFKNRKPEFIKL